MFRVEFERVRKTLKKLPLHIVTKLMAWAYDVEKFGLYKVQQISGYHDEPLKGERKGQRSIRLSRSYRAIYTVEGDNILHIVIIEEVTKHGY